MRRILRFAACFLLMAALVGMLSSCKPTGADAWDISNLEIDTTSQVCEPISFEDAVHLEAKVSAILDRYAEENLKEIEKEIGEMTESEVSYYQFIGSFSFSEIPELQGTLTTLFIVVNDPEPYIYEARDPLSEVLSDQSNVEWTHMDSSTTINEDGRSARVAAMGYLAVTHGEQSSQDTLSNTIFPAFTVSLSPTEP